MYGTILAFIKFNNFGTWRLTGPGIYFIHCAALLSIYLSPCVYMSPALIQINKVYECQLYMDLLANLLEIDDCKAVNCLQLNSVFPVFCLESKNFKLHTILLFMCVHSTT